MPLLPAFAASTTVDYKAVAADIAAQVSKTPDKGPTFVRLAWHSSGTYDKQSKDGGSGGGTIRFEKELAHGGNAGLAKTAVQWMEGIKSKYGDGLSYADLYTLGGGMYVRSDSSELDGMKKDMSFISLFSILWILSIHIIFSLFTVASIKAMGGPTIPWSSGRVDAPVEAVTPDGRLPNAESGPKGADPSDAAHLRTIFNRMGFNDQEIVALSGT